MDGRFGMSWWEVSCLHSFFWGKKVLVRKGVWRGDNERGLGRFMFPTIHKEAYILKLLNPPCPSLNKFIHPSSNTPSPQPPILLYSLSLSYANFPPFIWMLNLLPHGHHACEEYTIRAGSCCLIYASTHSFMPSGTPTFPFKTNAHVLFFSQTLL